MKLEILRVEDHGTLQSERIFLSVLKAANLEYYIVRDTTYIGDSAMSNKWVHAYQFQEQEVNAGDEIVLYTGTAPKKTERINRDQNTRYYYSWNLKECVWNNDGDLAVLYELEAWSSKKVKPAKSK
ncbi:MAG: hypothetical protein V4592_13925 [Bacteroidota bacterium]